MDEGTVERHTEWRILDAPLRQAYRPDPRPLVGGCSRRMMTMPASRSARSANIRLINRRSSRLDRRLIRFGHIGGT